MGDYADNWDLFWRREGLLIPLQGASVEVSALKGHGFSRAANSSQNDPAFTGCGKSPIFKRKARKASLRG
jgi:hypothetical protein